MSEAPLPQWAADYVAVWQKRLLLQEWRVRVSVEPSPGDDGSGSTMACVRVQPDIWRADIEVLNTIPTDEQMDGREDWQQMLIHELLHIRLGRLTDHVERDLLPELSPSAQSIASGFFRREVEPVIDILARVLRDMEACAHAA